MLTMLKDIFRPTGTKIVLSALVGPGLTVLGLFVTGMFRHGPHIVEYIALPLTLPYIVVVWLDLTNEFWWIALLIPAFVYWYIIFSLSTYLASRLRR